MNFFEEWTFISQNKSSHLNLWLWGCFFNHHSNIKSLLCLSHCVSTVMYLYSKELSSCQVFTEPTRIYQGAQVLLMLGFINIKPNDWIFWSHSRLNICHWKKKCKALKPEPFSWITILNKMPKCILQAQDTEVPSGPPFSHWHFSWNSELIITNHKFVSRF